MVIINIVEYENVALIYAPPETLSAVLKDKFLTNRVYNG